MSPSTAIRRAAGSGRERLERRPHRGRVRVVGVVVEARARGVAPPSPRGAPRAGAPPPRLRCPRRRTPDREGDRRRREEVGDLVRPRQRQADVRLAGGRLEAEARALRLRRRRRRAVTSASADAIPNRITRPVPAATAIASTRGSSALATNAPSGRSPSRISAFASAIASTDGKNWRCAAATSRSAATSGSKARESRERSPGSDSPISPTIHSGRRGRFTIDIAKPIWLFWLPGVFSTAKRRARIAAAKSFVVVFPAEPVMAASRKPIRRFFGRRELLERLDRLGREDRREAGRQVRRAGARRGARRAPRARPRARSRGRRRARRGSRRRDRPAGRCRESTATPVSVGLALGDARPSAPRRARRA